MVPDAEIDGKDRTTTHKENVLPPSSPISSSPNTRPPNQDRGPVQGGEDVIGEGEASTQNDQGQEKVKQYIDEHEINTAKDSTPVVNQEEELGQTTNHLSENEPNVPQTPLPTLPLQSSNPPHVERLLNPVEPLPVPSYVPPPTWEGGVTPPFKVMNNVTIIFSSITTAGSALSLGSVTGFLSERHDKIYVTSITHSDERTVTASIITDRSGPLRLSKLNEKMWCSSGRIWTVRVRKGSKIRGGGWFDARALKGGMKKEEEKEETNDGNRVILASAIVKPNFDRIIEAIQTNNHRGMRFTDVLDSVSTRFDAGEIMKAWMSRGRLTQIRPGSARHGDNEEKEESKSNSDSESEVESGSDSDQSLTDQIIKRQSTAAHIYTTRKVEKVTTRAVLRMLRLLLLTKEVVSSWRREEGKFAEDDDNCDGKSGSGDEEDESLEDNLADYDDEKIEVNAMNVSFMLSSLRFIRKNPTLTSNHQQYLNLYKDEKDDQANNSSTIRWKWLVGKFLECEQPLNIDFDQFVTFCWLASKLRLK